MRLSAYQLPAPSARLRLALATILQADTGASDDQVIGDPHEALARAMRSPMRCGLWKV